MKKIFNILLSSLFFTNIANAQVVSGGVSAPYTLHSQEFTSTGTFIVPTGVTAVVIDACAAGGGGGGGSVGAFNPGGGGGAGSGQWTAGYPLTVVQGATLTITIPTGGTAGTNAANGGVGGNLTITGATDTFPTLYGGDGGGTADGFYFGVGGNGGGPNGMGGIGDASILGNPSTLARPAFVFPYGGGGAGGGRGGGIDPFGGGAAVTATYGLPNGPFFSLGIGTGAQAGGGGAPSPYGNGGLGGNSGTPTNGATPTLGYCGGGGGAGASVTTTGGVGANGFARVRW